MFLQKLGQKLIFMQIKRAIILSAGYGKRLNPLTLFKPKPLLEINKKTLLENTIYILEKFGIEEIVINTHYLSDQINTYIDNKKFSSKIFLIEEHKKILDTGGGVLNAAKKFNNNPFFVFNPDTIWSQSHLDDFKYMEEQYFKNGYKSVLLVVDKKKSFDKNMNGDFNLKENIIDRESDEKKYIYTGSQILSNSVFKNIKIEPFSMNLIWDLLIKKKELLGVKSKQKFLHVTNLEIYNKLIEKKF